METNARSKPIEIGRLKFRSKVEAELHCRYILWKYGNGDRVIDDLDAEFLYALVEAHSRKKAIVDCGIWYFWVQWINGDPQRRRFCVRRKDSSIRDFSWRDVIYPEDSKTVVRGVLRTIVAPQITRFRMAYFSKPGPYICEVSGEELNQSNCHVDHIAPNTFERLATRWVGDVMHLSYEDIEIIPSRNYQTPSRLADSILSQQWYEFHAINARLRVIHAGTHMRLKRSGGLNGKSDS